MKDKPLLFLDVDGPLNPWKASPSKRPEGYETHRMMTPSWQESERKRLIESGRPASRVKPLRVWLKPSHGEDLLALPFTLLWDTMWGDEANDWIGKNIGLPELPVVDLSDAVKPVRSPYWRNKPSVHWKTEVLIQYAAGRPFAWVDDEITDLDKEYAATYHEGQALLRYIDPRLGLLEPDFNVLSAWAKNLQETS